MNIKPKSHIKIDQESLLKYFYYKDGNLYWKSRINNYSRGRINGIAGGVSGGYWVVNILGVKYKLHRLIYILHHGDIPIKMQIDHIDMNPLNNRIENLRLATHAQNKQNSRLQKNNTSGVKGVLKRSDCNKWSAQIGFEGTQKTIGLYKTKQEAVNAYRDAAINLHREFARF